MATIFQYPQSDRGRCNRERNLAGLGGCGTFSILSRIVGAATVFASERIRHQAPFQYPQSDRGRCNAFRAVSSGAWSITFSILSRIVGAATHAG